MSGYIGVQPVPQATQRREYFTATSGQTTFNTNGYTPGYIDVFMNGVKLSPSDFTATNGSDVVLASGATTGDLLQVISFTPFNVANQTFVGNVNLSSGAYQIGGNNVIDSSRIGSLASLSVGTTNTSAQLVVGDDTDSTATLLQLRNDDSTYSQSWTFSSDTSKDLVITGASGSGGIKLSPGSRGVDVSAGPLKVGGSSVVDASRNAYLTSLEVRGAGNATNRFNLSYNSTSGIATVGPNSTGGNTTFALGTSNAGTYATKLTVKHDGNVNIDSGGLQMGGTTVIDSSRAISAAAGSFTGTLTLNDTSQSARGSYTDLLIADSSASNNGQIELWGSNTSFAISHFDNDRLGIYSNVSGSWGESRGITILASNGNVGLGDTSPSYKLDVIGTGRFTGAVELGNTDSTVGDLRIYDTGNNSLRLYGTAANTYELDLLGTSAVGQLNFNQMNLAVDDAVQGNEPSQKGTLRFRQAGGAASAGGVEFHTSSGGGAGYGARVTADANGYMFLQTRSNASGWTTGLTVLNNKLNFDNAEGQSPSWDFSGSNYNEAGYSTNYNVKCIKLGRLVLQQGGTSAEIKLLCGAGYNAIPTQNRTFKLNLRTSNGNTSTVTNLGGTSSYVRIHGYGYVESRDPAAADNTTVEEWYITEVNSTTWDVYIKTQGLIGVYNTYSVLCTSSSASWTHDPSVVNISSLGSNTFAINANDRQLMLTGQSAHATASFGEGTGVTAGNKIPMTYIRAYKNLTVDQTNERFTVLYPGAYAIQYSFLGETAGTQAKIAVNGTAVAGSYTQCGSGNLTMSTTITQNLSQGDYVEFFCHAGTIHENANYTSMSMWLIG